MQISSTVLKQRQIIIDLSVQSYGDALDVSELIQFESYSRLKKLVDNVLISASENSQKSNIFFIDGTRGAGKTTFLKTAFQNLAPKEDTRLRPLTIIDPTLIETGEHVFFSILNALKDDVEKYVNLNCEVPSITNAYKNWRYNLQKLAKGANLLNAKPITEYSDDELNLEEGLENARSGSKLREQFDELLKQACAIVKTKAYLVVFDDIDTDFREGWKTLELIRRYLQSSSLVVFVTGDLQLYTHLVRNQQFQNLGSTLHQQDQQRAGERSQLVDHLEQQYLLKLFPLQNRVNLPPFSQLLERNSKLNRADQFQYVVRHPKFAKSKFKSPLVELNELTTSIVNDGFSVRDISNANLYKNFLLALPIRALFQILQVYCEDFNSPDQPQRLANSLRGTLLGSLYKLGLDVDALSYGDQAKLIEAVFNVVQLDGEFDTGSYLRPQPGSETLRNGFVGLAAEVAFQCYERPDRAIRYMLQAPGSLSLAHMHMSSENASQHDMFISTFKKEFSIGRQEDALNWARYAAPVLLSPFKDHEGIGPGVIKIASASRDMDFNSLSSIQKIAFRLATHNVMTSSTRTYMSIFNLLGAMERLLKIYDEPRKEWDKEVAKRLRRMSSTITVSAPSWLSGRDLRSNSPTIVDQEVSVEASIEEAISSSIPIFIEWIEGSRELSKSIQPSALMLGKIWTRLYFSLSRAHGAYKQQGFKSGTIMHMNTMCMVNAFLIEEFDFGNAETVHDSLIINRNNPLTRSATVNLKLRRVVETKSTEYFPFTTLLLHCPLIKAFMPIPREAVAQRPVAAVAAERKFIVNSFFNDDSSEYDRFADGLNVLNRDVLILGSDKR